MALLISLGSTFFLDLTSVTGIEHSLSPWIPYERERERESLADAHNSHALDVVVSLTTYVTSTDENAVVRHRVRPHRDDQQAVHLVLAEKVKVCCSIKLAQPDHSVDRYRWCGLL